MSTRPTSRMTTIRRFPALCCAWLFALPVLAGCGPEGGSAPPWEEPSAVERPWLAPEEPGRGTGSILAHHEILGEAGLWSIARGAKDRVLVSEATDGNRIPIAAGEKPQLGMRGFFDLAELSALVVDLVTEGERPLRVRASCQRRRSEIAGSEWKTVRGDETVTLELRPTPPKKKGKKAPTTGDKLILSFDAEGEGTATVVVHTVQEIGAATREGTEGLDAPLVTLGGEARRGFWLTPGDPLATEVSVGDGAELVFAYGVTPRLLEPSARARLVVHVDGTEAPVLEEVLVDPEADSDAVWRAVRVPLDRWAGRRVRIRFSLEAASRLSCPVADLAVLLPSERVRTVVLVTSDTHRGDSVGQAENGIDVKTPTLDDLGRRGVFFEDCQAPTNLTLPSHVSLMTGAHLRDHRILDNRTPLSPSANTLAERFKEAGFATFASVSAPFLRPRVSGLGQGFDRVAWPAYLKETRDAEETAAVVHRWLDDVLDRSVFVWIHLFDAHHPYEPPGPYDRLYYDAGKDPFSTDIPHPGLPDEVFPPELQGLRDLEFPLAQYRAEISYLDAVLGELFARPRMDEGVLAFVADHGECFGERGIYYSHGGLYPPNLHIPLILRYPGAPAGTRVPHRVTHVDLGRTLLNLAALEEAGFPGEDLRPLIDGWKTIDRDPEAETRFAVQAGGKGASITEGDLHLVLHLVKNKPLFGIGENERHAVELYHLEDDPECLRNLALEQLEVARRLRARLIAWLEAGKDLGLAGSSVQDPALLMKLQALGYDTSEAEAGKTWFEEDDCAWCQRFR